MAIVFMLLFFLLPFSCFSSWAESLPVLDQVQEDLDGDGVKETIRTLKVLEGGSDGIWWRISVLRNGQEIFPQSDRFTFTSMGAAYLVRDLTPRFPGKEIVIIWRAPEGARSKYGAIFFGFRGGKYILYNRDETDKEYSTVIKSLTLEQVLQEFQKGTKFRHTKKNK